MVKYKLINEKVEYHFLNIIEIFSLYEKKKLNILVIKSLINLQYYKYYKSYRLYE
jgi:hypothetical protein